MSNADKNWKNKALREIESDLPDFTQGAIHLPVAELRIGMAVVSSWKRIDIDGWESRVPLNTFRVETIVPCDGNNGMHRHVNKSKCYDSRAFVWIKA